MLKKYVSLFASSALDSPLDKSGGRKSQNITRTAIAVKINSHNFTSMQKKVFIYDTTLRDGTQCEGISLSVAAKLRLAEKMDSFGIDFIEGDFRWHYGAFDDEKYANGKKALEATYAKRVARVEKEAE